MHARSALALPRPPSATTSSFEKLLAALMSSCACMREPSVLLDASDRTCLFALWLLLRLAVAIDELPRLVPPTVRR